MTIAGEEVGHTVVHPPVLTESGTFQKAGAREVAPPGRTLVHLSKPMKELGGWRTES